MVPIILQGLSARKALELVSELKESGLIVHVDFEFYFYSEKIDHGKIHKRYCEFRFQEPKLATFYSLKWMMA
jgi:hypothetical protein